MEPSYASSRWLLLQPLTFMKTPKTTFGCLGCGKRWKKKHGWLKHKCKPMKKTTEPLRRIKHLAEYYRKKAVGWQRGNVDKRIQRAKYRAFKQAAQIVAEAKEKV